MKFKDIKETTSNSFERNVKQRNFCIGIKTHKLIIYSWYYYPIEELTFSFHLYGYTSMTVIKKYLLI